MFFGKSREGRRWGEEEAEEEKGWRGGIGVEGGRGLKICF